MPNIGSPNPETYLLRRLFNDKELLCLPHIDEPDQSATQLSAQTNKRKSPSAPRRIETDGNVGRHKKQRTAEALSGDQQRSLLQQGGVDHKKIREAPGNTRGCKDIEELLKEIDSQNQVEGRVDPENTELDHEVAALTGTEPKTMDEWRGDGIDIAELPGLEGYTLSPMTDKEL
ncbi:MAG: hypothetical protein VW378_07895 [bacterium]